MFNTYIQCCNIVLLFETPLKLSILRFHQQIKLTYLAGEPSCDLDDTRFVAYMWPFTWALISCAGLLAADEGEFTPDAHFTTTLAVPLYIRQHIGMV
jgi:hypothetical protein